MGSKENSRVDIDKVVYQMGYHPYVATVHDALRAINEGSSLFYVDDEGNEFNIPADLVVEAWYEFCDKLESYITPT